MRLILFLFVLPLLKAFISNSQWKTINSLLTLTTTNKLTVSQKSQLGKVIYIHYEKWTYYQAYQYKMRHIYKCRKIKQQELNLYASIGLSKAIANYNPLKCKNTTTFSSYAIHYIMCELRNGLNDLQTEHYKNANDIILVGDNDFLLDSKRTPNYNEHLQYETFWNNIYNMDIPSFVKKIIIIKYSFECKKLMPNKK